MKKNKKEKLLVDFGNYILNREVINPENKNCVTDADLRNFFDVEDIKPKSKCKTPNTSMFDQIICIYHYDNGKLKELERIKSK